jgi:hypothetical protein
LGDTANSGPNGGNRIRAGTVAQSGGIQSGDDLSMRFIPWTGELRDGGDAVLFRPAVWVYFGDDREFFVPYTKMSFNQSPHSEVLFGTVAEEVEVHTAAGIVPLRPPIEYYAQLNENPPGAREIRAALNRSGLAVDLIPSMTLKGRWSNRVDRPMGMVVNVGNALDGNSYAAVWTERAIVLTREKVEQALARGARAATVVMHVAGTMSGARAMPLGMYTLYLNVERAAAPSAKTDAGQDDEWKDKLHELLKQQDQSGRW